MSEPFKDKMCRMAVADLNDLSAAVSEAIEKIDVIIGSAYCDRKLHDKLWDIRLVLLEALPSTKTSDELAGRKKPRFNEGTKVTLTLSQLKKLVKEAKRVNEDDEQETCTFKEFRKFAKSLGYKVTSSITSFGGFGYGSARFYKVFSGDRRVYPLKLREKNQYDPEQWDRILAKDRELQEFILSHKIVDDENDCKCIAET